MTGFQDPSLQVTQQSLAQQAAAIQSQGPQQDPEPVRIPRVTSPVDFDAERQRNSELYKEALKQDPLLYMRAQEFAKKRGLAPEVADSNVDVMNDVAEMQRRDIQRLRDEAPTLYSLMQNPYFHKMAAKETDKLKIAELNAGGWLARQFEAQARQLEYSTVALNAVANGANPETLARLRHLKELQRLYAGENDDSWAAWGVSTMIQAGMYIGETAAITAATALASGPAGVVTGPLAGFSFIAGSEAGQLVGDLLVENDDRARESKPLIDIGAAMPAIAGAAVVAGALDMVGFKAVARPWRSELLKGALRSSAETFKDLTAQKAWAGFRSNLLTSWGGETLTEGAQKAVMIVGEHIARASADPQYGDRLDWGKLGEQMWTEVWSEIGAAGVGIAPIAIMGASRRVRRDLALARMSDHQRQKWTDVVSQVRDTDLHKNAPSGAATAVAKVLHEHGQDFIFVNVQDMTRLMEEADAFEVAAISDQVGAPSATVKRATGEGMGRASASLRQLLPDVARQIDEAVDGTVDVKIPVADFAEHLAGRRIGLKLEADGLLKFDANGMTAEQTKVAVKKYQKQLKALLAWEAASPAPGAELPQMAASSEAMAGQSTQIVDEFDFTGIQSAAALEQQDQQVSDSIESKMARDLVSSGMFADTEEGRADAEAAAAMESMFVQQVAQTTGQSVEDVAADQGIIWESQEASVAAPEQATPAQQAAPQAAPRNVPTRLQTAVLREIGRLADDYQKQAKKWAAGRMSDEEFADSIVQTRTGPSLLNKQEWRDFVVRKLKDSKEVAGWAAPVRTLASMGLPRDQEMQGEVRRQQEPPPDAGLPAQGEGGTLEQSDGRPSETRGDSADATQAGELRDGGGLRGGTFLLDEPTGPKPGAPLAGLPTDFKVAGQVVTFGPSEVARQIARQYVAEQGLLYSPPAIFAPLDADRGRRIAEAYDRLQHTPDDPRVIASYRALAEETVKQYKAMLKSGITVLFNPKKDGEDVVPYPEPRQALLDIRDNNRLYIFSTEDGYGQSGITEQDRKENPMLADSGFMFGDKPALINDLFRAVHDYFGHYKEGFGFRARGEENAWQQHMAMYSPLARGAATTELRGQNSWVNFGPYGEQNAKADGSTTVYAPQKIGLMPDWVVTEGWLGLPQRLPARAGSGGNLSPALAWGTKADAVRRDSLQIHLPTLETALAPGGEDFLRKNVSLFRGGVQKVKDKKTGKTKKVTTYDSIQLPKGTVREKAESVVTQIQRNLTYIWKAIPPEIRNRSRLWYVGANRIANGFALRYGKTLEQMAGMLAVLSPQADWRMNVSYCERICDFMRRHDAGEEFAWTPELEAWAQDWLNSKEETKARLSRERQKQNKLVSAEKKLKVAEAEAAAAPERRGLQTALRKATALVERRRAEIAEGDDNVNTHKLIVEAKSFRNLSGSIAKAFFVRAYDEVVNGTQFADVSPEGEFLGPVLNDNKTPQTLAWKSMNAIAKAIKVWEASSNTEVDAALNVVSDQLGGEHKVRNFYNNILDPHSETAFYTSDTHQVAAGMMLPLGASAVEVGQNFGTNGSSSSSFLGLSGTYFLHHEAGIRTAAEVSSPGDTILPREVQSVTWEGIRNLFSDTFKSNESNIEAVRAIWRQVAAGEKTYEQAVDEIVKFAGGFRPPSWVGIKPGSGRTPESGAKTYGRPIQGDGVSGLRSGRSAGGSSGRGGKAVSRRKLKLKSTGFRSIDTEYAAKVAQLGIGTPEAYAKATARQKAMLWQYVQDAATVAGYDVPAFHGTNKTTLEGNLATAKPFTVFRTEGDVDLGSHFSVERAVADWFAGKRTHESQLFNVYLGVKNPLRLRDAGVWNSATILPQLVQLGYFPSLHEANEAFAKHQAKAMRELVDARSGQPVASGAREALLKLDESRAAMQRALHRMIEGLGFDSVIYVNRREVFIGDEATESGGGMPKSRTKRLEKAIADDYAGAGRVPTLSDEEFLARVPEARDAYIIWDATKVKSADEVTFDEKGRMIPLSERFNVSKNSILYSGARKEGEIDIETRRARLLDTGNLKAVVHEQAHNMMRWLFSAANSPNAPAGVVRDTLVLLNWFGIRDLGTWNGMTIEQQEAHWEAFAYSYEKFLFEGVAPSPGLRGVFQRLSRWIRKYYQDIVENINVAYRAATGRDLPMLTDDVRAVMGRMLSADQAVQDAMHAHSLEPLFQTRDQFLGTDDEWNRQQEMQEEARMSAVDQLTMDTAKQLRWAEPLLARARSEDERMIATVRRRLRVEVESELSQQPVYRMLSYFKTGRLIGEDGNVIRDDANSPNGHKLDRDALRRITGTDKYQRMERDPSGRPRTVEVSLDRYQRRDGIDPEVLASAFGFITTDDEGVVSADVMRMVDALVTAPALKDAVDAETQRRMERDYGSLVDPKQREQRVLEAISGEMRARLVASEATWLDDNLKTMASSMSPEKQRQVQRAVDALASIDPQLENAKIRRKALLSKETDIQTIDLQELSWLDLRIEALERQRARFAAAARSTVSERVLVQAAAGVARQNLGGRIISEVNAADFIAREKAEAQNARDAMTRKITSLTGDAIKMRYRAASQFKQRQLLYQQMAAEALTIRRETEEFRTFVSRLFNIGKVRAKQIEMSYVHVAQALLTELGYAPPTFTAERAESIYQTIAELDPALWQSIKPTVDNLRMMVRSLPPAPAGSDPIVPWRRLTVSQWREMRDVVEALYDAARERGEYLTAERRESFQACKELLLTAINERTPGGPIPGDQREKTDLERKVGWFRSWTASLRRVEHYMLKLDGGTEGTWTRLIWKPINAAFVAYEARRHEVLRRYADLLKRVPKENDLPKDRRKIEFRGRNGQLIYTFTDIQHLLGALLHVGNMSNKRKMLLGGSGKKNPWARMVVDQQTGQARLDSSDWDAFVEGLNNSGRLKLEHWQFLQDVWNLTESLLPDIQRAHKHIAGSIIKTVGRSSIVNKYGTFAGGYVPAKIDSEKSALGARVETLAELQADMRNQMPMANDGFAKERIESVAEPLVMDLRMVESHLDQVVRYVEVAPYAADTNRLLTDYTVLNAMHRMDPSLYDGVLRPWLSRALNNTTSTPHDSKLFNWMFSALRRNTTLGKMFLNVPNALQNLSGLPIALLRIPPRYWANAVFTFATGGWRQMGENARQSAFMDQSLGNQMAGLINEMRNYVEAPSAYGKLKQFVGQHGLFLQGFTQNIVDIIVWNAAFDESMSNADVALEQAEARDHAIRYADSVVRTSQLSLRAIDLSKHEAGVPFVRLLTQFASYFNSVAQANITAFEQVKRSVGLGPQAVPHLLYAYLVGLALPAMIGDAIIRAIGKGFEEEDDEGRMVTAWFDLLIGSQARFAAGALPFGQQVASLTTNAWDDARYNDRMSAGPAIESLVRGSSGAWNALEAMFTRDGKMRPDTPRDVMTLLQLVGGVPVEAFGRQVGFLTKVAMGKVRPETTTDWARGLLSGQAREGIRR